MLGFSFLLAHHDTPPADLQSLLDPCLCLIHHFLHDLEDLIDISTVVPPEMLDLMSSALLEYLREVQSVALEERHKTRLQQILYIISTHPVWPLVRREIERLPDASAILVEGPLPPDFVPPSDWNLNLSDHWSDWTSQPTAEEQVGEEIQGDGSVHGEVDEEGGQHGDPGQQSGAAVKGDRIGELSREGHPKMVPRSSPIRSLTRMSIDGLEHLPHFLTI